MWDRSTVPVYAGSPPEDTFPVDLHRRLVREWSSPATTVVWAAIVDDAAETLRRELRGGDPGEAYSLLLSRAIETLPLALSAPELVQADTVRR
jgi:hypothetical protein